MHREKNGVFFKKNIDKNNSYLISFLNESERFIETLPGRHENDASADGGAGVSGREP